MSSKLLKEIENLTALARINLETSTNNLKAIDTLGVRIDTMGVRMEQAHKDAMARMDRMESDWDKKHCLAMEQMDEQHRQTMERMDRTEADWDKKHRLAMEQMDEQHRQTMERMAEQHRQTAEQHHQAMARLDKLEAIANSNARAIQAWGDRAS